MKKKNNIFKKVHNWAREHSLAGLFIGIGLFFLPIAFQIMQYANIDPDQDPAQAAPELPMYGLLSLVFAFLLFYGLYLMIWSFVSMLRKGSRPAGFIFGLFLLAAGIALFFSFISNYQAWANAVEGSVIKYGPIILPGIFFLILVPLAGLLFTGYGFYRAVRAFLPEKYRQKSKFKSSGKLIRKSSS
ncbi:MAG: hypothetical protein K9J30_05100 [Bacteroidales bacterium]|nr:hypothetical protein [Bacteroidales bacterium]